jgi:AAA family ATP:ADP antiporter
MPIFRLKKIFWVAFCERDAIMILKHHVMEVNTSKLTWLQKLWPIQKCELKKFIPLILLKFFISLNYCLFTCMKDSLVVTAKYSGAEVIPVLKGWLVLPISLIAALIYSKLSNVLKRATVFYSIIGFFMAIVCLYSFVLYPHADLISPHRTADWLTAKIGVQYTHWIAVYRHWIHAIFFVTAELWGQIVIYLLFWGFSNHICHTGEAKRTYTLFNAAGDIAPIMTGPIIWIITKHFAGSDFTPTLQALTFLILFCAAIIVSVYWWMNRYVLVDKRFFNPQLTKQTVNQKTKLSLMKSIKHICSSKYLLSMAVLVVSCALVINMVEVSWKAHLKLQYPNTADYQAFLGNLLFLVGIVAFITAVFFGGNSLRIFGWRFSAQITPVFFGVSGILFLLFCLFKNHLTSFTNILGLTPLMFIVLFGLFQNVFSKGMKYTFFDATKEMAYIPLDPESKVKGKAAIDMVGSRLGKSGSSWIQIFLIQLAGTGSVLSITPYLIPIVFGVSLYWCYSVNYLGKEISTREREPIAAKTASQLQEG